MKECGGGGIIINFIKAVIYQLQIIISINKYVTKIACPEVYLIFFVRVYVPKQKFKSKYA